MDLHMEIVNAIQQKRVLAFMYENKFREVEPYIYGISTNGHEILSAYQISGESRSNLPDWKTFHIDKISDLRITTQSIHPHGRGYNQKDKLFKTIFAKVF